MATRDFEPLKTCPFWLALSMECRICKGGLFIPLDDHIEAFCKSNDFPRCLQFSLHPKNQMGGILKNDQTASNRRNFVRVAACYKITLVRLIPSGTVVSHFSAFANTLDLSAGGMRLMTNKPIANDSVLRFSFDDSFPQELHEGTGLVAWCNKDIDTPGYQAGVAFQDDRIIEAMGLYLGLHHREM